MCSQQFYSQKRLNFWLFRCFAISRLVSPRISSFRVTKSVQSDRICYILNCEPWHFRRASMNWAGNLPGSGWANRETAVQRTRAIFVTLCSLNAVITIAYYFEYFPTLNVPSVEVQSSRLRVGLNWSRGLGNPGFQNIDWCSVGDM